MVISCLHNNPACRYIADGAADRTYSDALRVLDMRQFTMAGFKSFKSGNYTFMFCELMDDEDF